MIYISQPRMQLKYRGVSYYTKDISRIDIYAVEIDPSIVRSIIVPVFQDNLVVADWKHK